MGDRRRKRDWDPIAEPVDEHSGMPDDVIKRHILFQGAKKRLSRTRYPPQELFTQLHAHAGTETCRAAAVPTRTDLETSTRNGSGEDAVITLPTVIGEFLNIRS